MRRLLLPTALLCILASCAAEPIAPAGGGANFTFDFADPAADTLAWAGSASAGTAIDARGLSGSVTVDELTLKLTFGAAIMPWSAAQSGSLDGFLDIDVDEDATTGIAGAADDFGGDAQLGADYYLSLRDVEPGYVALVSVQAGSYAPVPAEFVGSTLTVHIPRANFGASDDGNYRVSAVIGHPGNEATDLLPNVGNYAIHRPQEPSASMREQRLPAPRSARVVAAFGRGHAHAPTR